MPERLKPKLGLLPLILQLYNDTLPELKEKQQELVIRVAGKLGAFADVEAAPICSLSDEVAGALAQFQDSGCDAVIVIFTAYAPSLMAADALAASPLPLILFNTQIANELDRDDLGEAMLRNHGMHGVQDLANVLLRKGRPHWIVTGHWSESEPLAELEQWARAAAVKRRIASSSVGLIGGAFEGMGDFQFDPEQFAATFGATIKMIDQKEIAEAAAALPAEALAKATAAARTHFVCDEALTDADIAAAEALAAAILGKLDAENCCAWSQLFLSVGDEGVLSSMPFLAASRSMAWGYGYAGEGDALGAVGVFAAQQLGPEGETSFTEMFCMDPKNNAVLLSHMGEANYELAAGDVHLLKKAFRFGECDDPPTPVFAFKPGEATLINLVPGPGGEFRYITADVTMEEWELNLGLAAPQGYFTPCGDLGDFLTAYSELGGSHHMAITYGAVADRIAKFAAVCGIEHFHIGAEE